MNRRSPVYSVNTQCRDCYKCVRHCPVKAIYVENDHAVVEPSACILCGRCVGVCRNTAKQVRDDLPAVRLLMQGNKLVYVSLAPAFKSEFPGVRTEQMATALKRLGFAGVCETAAGAEAVSDAVTDLIADGSDNLYLSTACPVAVKLVTHYFPKFTRHLTPVLPPMLAHCRQIRMRHGDVPVVFIGPCVGKKEDADLHSDLLAFSLTFEELRRWFIVKGIDPADMPDDAPADPVGDGALYPLEGGMNETVLRRFRLRRPDVPEPVTMTVSGIRELIDLFDSLDPAALDSKVFIELLACAGGCVRGPKSRSVCTAKARLDVLSYAAHLPTAPAKTGEGIAALYHSAAVVRTVADPEQIRKVLRELGKYQPEDELNCGGCGYDNCRDLATAILAGHAEAAMCVSHMRQLAQKKSSAIDRALPYGLVVADSSLLILECNERFARLFGETLIAAYESRPGLRDADLARIIPFPNLFKSVLDTGREIIRKNIAVEERILSVSIFNIEPHTVVGALILDVTESEQRRRQLIDKARTVIQNTSKTVQEIAFMLGRNTAQSELILNSAVELFAAEAADSEA